MTIAFELKAPRVVIMYNKLKLVYIYIVALKKHLKGEHCLPDTDIIAILLNFPFWNQCDIETLVLRTTQRTEGNADKWTKGDKKISMMNEWICCGNPYQQFYKNCYVNFRLPCTLLLHRKLCSIFICSVNCEAALLRYRLLTLKEIYWKSICYNLLF
jgi:hypothetical protein